MATRKKKIKIGLVGSNKCENKRKIKETIFKLYQRFGEDLVVVSGGGMNGAEKYVKKFALELGCSYREFNPSHTMKNLYSALHENFYGKDYKPANFYHRNKLMAKDINSLIVFSDPSDTGSEGYLDIIKNCKKLQKNVVIIR